ncbi:MAG: tRNA uridine-5-carboxymethylaminomethyl(34) synthesis enzyme MnmG [Thioalkalivibrionaceae bacterium]
MSRPTSSYDVIVIGGGHAGTEAAAAAARRGARTLLLTQRLDAIGQMSCNPAIGGIGKGHLVREIDALDGLMARAADAAGIHWRLLNQRKGPAVRATRAQADRNLYASAVQRLLWACPGLAFFQGMAADIEVVGDRVVAVVTESNVRLETRAVVLTAGTFLNGVIHVGLERSTGGRAGEPPSTRLASRLREMASGVGRLKTGTPPRIDRRSVDFSQLTPQPGDEPRPVFSFIGSAADHPQQTLCHITYTNERTHDVIRANLDRSPMYSGEIEGVGPRYCPSIEDKIVRFAERDRHQVFIEPEGLDQDELYPNGISTSLPFDVQVKIVQSLEGLASARITRPGYAIEYDYFDPRGLNATLATRAVANLFFAGQINGTTGYEEAAAQGLVAGANAAASALEQAPLEIDRGTGYIGVLIDDLIQRGTQEPYRMFTSRAEYRLLLREDNADLRLTPIGRKLGLVDDERWRRHQIRAEAIATERERLQTTRIDSADLHAAPHLFVANTPLPTAGTSLYDYLRRPEVAYSTAAVLQRDANALAPDVAEQLEIECHYAGYIERAKAEAARQRADGKRQFPPDIDFHKVHGLSHELREKLTLAAPRNFAQAQRLAGVTPAALTALSIHLKNVTS